MRDDRIADDERDAGQGRGQLPQAAEQAVGAASREQHAAALLDPERGLIELGQLVRLLARGHDRQLVLAAVAARHT